MAEAAVELGRYVDAGAAGPGEAERDSAAAQIGSDQTVPGSGPGTESGFEGVRGQPGVAFAVPAFACTDAKARNALHAQGAVDASASAAWTGSGWSVEVSAGVPVAGPDAG